MMRRRTHRLCGPIAAVLVLATCPAVLACPVCTGNPESPLTQGAQQGILTMLVITYAVVIGLFGMLAFVIVCARRRHHTTSQPCVQCPKDSQIGPGLPANT